MTMIEIIYKDETKKLEEGSEMFHIPRNIRQIGLCGGKNRIYVEDYVYTFMNRITEKTHGDDGSLAILMGTTEWNEGNTYIFVKGAIYLDEPVNTEHISLENESWKKIQDIEEKYFSELDVVGWFLSIPQLPVGITELIGRTHLKYFSGGEKILMMMDPQEKDEAFFCYENGRFTKAPGYYLYYEKNQKMQEYMTDYKWWETSEKEKVIPDEAVKNFRKKFLKKTETQEEKEEKTSVFSYVATACLVIAIVATGANFINNYQKIQTVEENKNLEAAAVFTIDDQIQISPTSAAETVINENEKKDEKQETSLEDENSITEDAEDTTGVNGGGETLDPEEKMPDEKEAEVSLSAEEEKEQETSGKSILETYMIRPGDTLYQISILNYGNVEAIKEICRMNNISEEEKIYPGQIIVLP